MPPYDRLPDEITLSFHFLPAGQGRCLDDRFLGYPLYINWLSYIILPLGPSRLGSPRDVIGELNLELAVGIKLH